MKRTRPSSRASIAARAHRLRPSRHPTRRGARGSAAGSGRPGRPPSARASAGSRRAPARSRARRSSWRGRTVAVLAAARARDAAPRRRSSRRRRCGSPRARAAGASASSASRCDTCPSAAAPKMTRALWWPVAPNGASVDHAVKSTTRVAAMGRPPPARAQDGGLAPARTMRDGRGWCDERADGDDDLSLPRSLDVTRAQRRGGCGPVRRRGRRRRAGEAPRGGPSASERSTSPRGAAAAAVRAARRPAGSRSRSRAAGRARRRGSARGRDGG